MPKAKQALEHLPVEAVIRVIRGQKVILDSDLAHLYGVPTKAFNQAVRRNMARFPEDFMFQLSPEEAADLRSQIVTLKNGRGQHSKYTPSAFTEHGVAMLSAILRSERAVEMSILIVRAFVRMRELIAASHELAARIERLEHEQGRTVSVIEAIVEDLNRLSSEMEQMKALPEPTKRRIGFNVP